MMVRNPIEEQVEYWWTGRTETSAIRRKKFWAWRSRQNNLRFSGFTDKAEGAETWEQCENLIREVIEENLEMERKDITIERPHEINGKKRPNNVKFLNYKDKDAVLNQHRQKHC